MAALVYSSEPTLSPILQTNTLFCHFFHEATKILDTPKKFLDKENAIAEIIANFELIVTLANHAVANHILINEEIIKSIQATMEHLSNIIDNHSKFGICEVDYIRLRDIYAQLSISMCTILIQKDATLRSLVISGNQDA